MGSKKGTRRRTPASAPCPECGRAFSRNDSLSRHLKTHLNHADQRPFHRIINEKFRACNRCRSSKIRCTGSTPCSRCVQLNEECSYERGPGGALLVRTTSSTMSEDAQMATSMPSSPSQLSQTNEQPKEQPQPDEP